MESVLDIPLRHVELGPSSELQRSESFRSGKTRLRGVLERAVREARVRNDAQSAILLAHEENAHRSGCKKSWRGHAALKKALQILSVPARRAQQDPVGVRAQEARLLQPVGKKHTQTAR